MRICQSGARLPNRQSTAFQNIFKVLRNQKRLAHPEDAVMFFFKTLKEIAISLIVQWSHA